MRRFLLTCFAIGDDYAEEMRGMLASFERHQPGAPRVTGVFPRDGYTWQEASNFKVEWLTRVKRAFPRADILWVDADARFRRAVIPPPVTTHLGARNYAGDRVSTGTLWCSREVPVDFFDWWADSPGESNEHALQHVLQHYEVAYQELSDSMTSVVDIRQKGWDGTLEHDSAIVHWNRSRSVVGGLEDWPPPEETRRKARVQGDV